MSRDRAPVAEAPDNHGLPVGGEGGDIAQAALILALGNVSSRSLGLVRETVISHLFGATGMVSAFRVASIVPTMIYDLLIGGMISAALVPVFSDYLTPDKREELCRLVSALFTLVAVVFSAVVLILEIAAPGVAWLLGGGFDSHLLSETTRLMRLILPAVLFFGLSGAAAGLLYADKRFVYPAFGASVFNAGIVLMALFFGDRVGIASLSLGVLLGSILQLAIQLPGLRDMGLSFSLDLRHPGLRRMGGLYLPVALGLIVSQVGIGIDRNLASRTGEQSIAWMQNATTLIQFPLGLVAVAVSTAVLPSLSRLASSADMARFRRTLGMGLRVVILLIVPATAGLLILATPVVALLFEHGAFKPYDTVRTVQALRLYLIGLPFAAIDQLLIFAFYARKDTRTPVLVGVLGVLTYLIVALTLITPLGMLGLVLANSVQLSSHALIMLYLAHRYFDGLRDQGLGKSSAKVIIASAVTGVAVLISIPWLTRLAAVSATWGELLVVLSGGCLGLLTYGIMTWLLRVEDVTYLRKMVAARLASGLQSMSS
ncbi:MAG TPA: murein biosynthesis integral membrane protein MurJ [Anaerolineae bacterium]|nr:murein biosynthesis integral membrane protein MurJ [Anaerolineae bacterium]